MNFEGRDDVVSDAMKYDELLREAQVIRDLTRQHVANELVAEVTPIVEKLLRESSEHGGDVEGESTDTTEGVDVEADEVTETTSVESDADVADPADTIECVMKKVRSSKPGDVVEDLERVASVVESADLTGRFVNACADMALVLAETHEHLPDDAKDVSARVLGVITRRLREHAVALCESHLARARFHAASGDRDSAADALNVARRIVEALNGEGGLYTGRTMTTRRKGANRLSEASVKLDVELDDEIIDQLASGEDVELSLDAEDEAEHEDEAEPEAEAESEAEAKPEAEDEDVLEIDLDDIKVEDAEGEPSDEELELAEEGYMNDMSEMEAAEDVNESHRSVRSRSRRSASTRARRYVSEASRRRALRSVVRRYKRRLATEAALSDNLKALARQRLSESENIADAALTYVKFKRLAMLRESTRGRRSTATGARRPSRRRIAEGARPKSSRRAPASRRLSEARVERLRRRIERLRRLAESHAAARSTRRSAGRRALSESKVSKRRSQNDHVKRLMNRILKEDTLTQRQKLKVRRAFASTRNLNEAFNLYRKLKVAIAKDKRAAMRPVQESKATVRKVARDEQPKDRLLNENVNLEHWLKIAGLED